MGRIVYLQRDTSQVLYDLDSIPKDLKTVEPDAAALLRILKKKLQFLGISNLDWMNCPISFSLPKNPVYYPTSEGIKSLYEKSELTAWFDKTGGTGRDPTGLNEKVSLKDYKQPTTDEILTFVMTTSAVGREFLVNNYVEINSEEDDLNFEAVPLISEAQKQKERSSPSTMSRAALRLRSIFCCIPINADEEEPSKDFNSTITY